MHCNRVCNVRLYKYYCVSDHPDMNNKTHPSSDPALPVGLLRRLGALFYDALLTLAVLLLATALAVAVTQNNVDPSGLWFRLYLVGVVFVFYGWFWTHGGQTLGMRAWKIRLERLDGTAIGWGQALARFLAGVLTAGVGHLWLLFDGEGRSLYDRITATRMIRVAPKYVPPMQ